MADANIYTVGGTVQTNRQGIYIPRQADEELLALCRAGKFAYVLTPRQMGKSSLMVRTAFQLRNEGIQSVMIDLTGIGTQVKTAEQWYLGLLIQVEAQLELDTDVHQWWQLHTHLGFTQRLTEFFQRVLLVEVTSSIVLFIDEIDTTLSLDFTDDFYAAIRYLYVSRAFLSEFERLSFVLFGVATPGDLIRDPKRTPFNVGQRVDLTDFTLREAKPLAEGLGLPTLQAQQVLEWVLNWTGGHPYLSQRLCSIISQQSDKSWLKADVDRVVSSTLLGAMSEQDNNLQFVRDMLTKRAPDLAAVLTIYREIRRGKRSVPDEEQSIIKSHLKLSGVVKRDNGVLKVRNRIYQRVFDLRWVNQHLPLNLRDLWERYKPALPYVVGLVVFSVSMGALALYANTQRLNANTQRLNAEKALRGEERQRQQAEAALKEGDKQRQKAEAALQEAEKQRQQAKLQAQNAQKEKLRAELENQEAQKQKKNAQQQRQRAEKGESRAKQAQLIAEERKRQAVSARNAETQQRQIAEQQRNNSRQSEHKAIIAKAEAEKRRVNAEVLAQSLTTENLFASSVELEALLSGLKVGKNLRKYGNAVDTDNRTKAILALRQVVYGLSERNRLEGHSGIVISVVFSPDGKTIATGSDDTSVKLWNLSGQELYTLKGHTGIVNSVVFSPDGKTIATGSDDKTVKLWNMNLDDLLIRGCDWIYDYLKNNPNVKKDDRRLCDDIPKRK